LKWLDVKLIHFVNVLKLVIFQGNYG